MKAQLPKTSVYTVLLVLFFALFDNTGIGQTTKDTSRIHFQNGKRYTQNLSYSKTNVSISCDQTVPDRENPAAIIELPFRLDSCKVQLTGNLKSISFNRGAILRGNTILSQMDLSGSKFKQETSFAQNIFRKKVSIDGATFDGPFYCGFSIFEGDFSSTSLHSLVRDDFKKTMFHDEADFSLSKFTGVANFSFSIFQKGLDFQDAEFNTIAFFDYAEFNNTTYFNKTKFKNAISFTASKFYGVANFRETEFEYVDFSSSKFSGETSFFMASFSKGLYARQVNFSSDTYFDDSRLKSYADFQGDSIYAYLGFQNTKFGTVLDLSFLVAGKDFAIDLLNAHLPHLIDFSNNTNLPTTVNFTEADFNNGIQEKGKKQQRHYINVYKTDLPKVKIDYQHFRLCFFNSKKSDPIISKFVQGDSMTFKNPVETINYEKTYEKLLNSSEFLDYLNTVFPNTKPRDTLVKTFILYCLEYQDFPSRLTEDEIISTYEKVLKNFDTEGQKVSYETLDIEYKDFKFGAFNLAKIWNLYGYRKEWIFIWTLIFLLIFTSTTYLRLDRLNKEISAGGVYYVSNIPPRLPEGTFKEVLRKFWYALMYTSTIFFLFSLKIENLNFNKKVGVLYIILIYSVGILCLGYMASFVLQK